MPHMDDAAQLAADVRDRLPSEGYVHIARTLPEEVFTSAAKQLGIVSVASVLLPSSKSAVLVGAGAVPSWRVFAWTTIAAAAAYGLILWFLNSPATCYALAALTILDQGACNSSALIPWLNMYPLADTLVMISIVALIALTFGIGRRRAPPVAQGYFDASIEIRKEGSDDELVQIPPKDAIPQSTSTQPPQTSVSSAPS